ncbi:MAG: hypothetical protein ACYTG7_06765 [Planctomycetota bacterium]
MWISLSNLLNLGNSGTGQLSRHGGVDRRNHRGVVFIRTIGKQGRDKTNQESQDTEKDEYSEK